MTVPAILALDLGTSSAKAIVTTMDGSVLGRGQASYPTLHPRPGRDEQNIDDWLQAIESAAASARRFAPQAQIAGIGITGQMHGTVMLDEDGTPLHPGIIWSDRRAAQQARAIGQRIGRNLSQVIGGPLATGYLGPTVAWIHDNEPAVYRHIRRVLLPVDLLGYLLTGNLATVPSNAIGSGLMRLHDSQWEADLLSAMHVEQDWLPPILAEGSVIGNLSPAMADIMNLQPAIPVIHGGGDVMAAAAATGVISGHDALIVLSTGAQVVLPTATKRAEPNGRWHIWPSALPPPAPGTPWLSVGTLLSAGRVIDWIHRTLAPDAPIAEVLELAESAPTGADGLLFLPYLAGERTPLLDPFARGVYLGLTDAHERRHLVRAALEGIALSIADVLQTMAPNEDMSSLRIVLSGGAAARALRQILAEAIGHPLEIAGFQDSSALGAARIAAHVLGSDAISGSTMWGDARSTTIRPQPSLHPSYAHRLELYRQATRAMLPIVHRLQQEP